MQIIRSIKKMQTVARDLAALGKTIGLVPTMGFLHDGHLSLVKCAKREADIVITTIFVNPTQFAPSEDLANYPRDEKGDLSKLRSVGNDIVFIPKADQIYPDNFQTYVTVENLTKVLEGARRPNHFKGVTTIVAKLFNLTRPDMAVFGMKDFQQAIVLRQMTKDLGYPIKIVIAPTRREKDGTAMSSRNKYFSPEQRPDARALYLALRKAKTLVRAGRRDAKTIEKEMRILIKSVCPTAKIDYIAFNDLDTLAPLKKVRKPTICSLAVRMHNVRLIDNQRLL